MGRDHRRQAFAACGRCWQRGDLGVAGDSPVNAHDLLALLLDPGTFRSWDAGPVDVRPDPAYAADLAEARRTTGLDESVVTGEGLLGGRRVAVAACEFGFLGGSVGIAAAERLTRAVERATAERLPLIALRPPAGPACRKAPSRSCRW